MILRVQENIAFESSVGIFEKKKKEKGNSS